MIINPIISLWIMIPLSIFILLMVLIYSIGIKKLIRFLLLVILFIVNLRIMLPNGDITVYENNLDIIFIVDSTLSMAANDVKPTRLDQVKKDINYIIDKTAGASYATITFDNNAYTRMIMTKDANAISASVDSITVINKYYARGTKVTLFRSQLEKMLEKEKDTDHKVIVYIFTDGENTSDNKEDSLNHLKKYIDGGAVLGYGTTKGSTIKIDTYYGETEDLYYYDENYRSTKAFSKIDEDNMKNIALDLGIDYIHMTSTNEVDKSINEISKEKNSVKGDQKKYIYKDTYYFITPLIGILLLIELYNYRKVRL